MILLYIICKDKKEAILISKHLLNKKLIACSNFFPIESMYLWQNKIQTSKEYVLILKTEKNKYNQIEKEVKVLHSYTTPCIIKLVAKANKEYQEWLQMVIK